MGFPQIDEQLPDLLDKIEDEVLQGLLQDVTPKVKEKALEMYHIACHNFQNFVELLVESVAH